MIETICDAIRQRDINILLHIEMIKQVIMTVFDLSKKFVTRLSVIIVNLFFVMYTYVKSEIVDSAFLFFS